MRSKLPYPGFMIVMVVGLALTLASGMFNPACAGSEDVAMFYEELAHQGQWVDYENYGPVWMPSNVQEDWRPYVDGRWTPTEEGYVFETKEPWGWATYHYGNWMPTESYGWVWVPGRTWYPSTVTWRTSPEEAPVGTSYVGWAPIPPPNYVPPPAYAPTGGYYAGMPATDLITAPFFIFATAAQFLLGFGQPFAPAYSYSGCGCLAPPPYVPVFFPQTVIVSNYVVPRYYPPAFIGGPMRFGAYNWGPPIPYLARVTRINPTVINQTIVYNTTNISRINNILAPNDVRARYHYINQIIPPALAQGKALPPHQPVRDLRMAQANLGKPNIIPAPRQMPQVPMASIPKLTPGPIQGGPRGIVGAGLPGKAVQPLTPGMQQQVHALPPTSKITPVQPIKPPIAEAKPGMAPAVTPPRAKPGVVPPTGPGAVPPGTKPGVAPPTAKRGVAPPTKPPGAKPGVTPPTAKPGAVSPPPGPKPGGPPPHKAQPATPASKPPAMMQHPGPKPQTVQPQRRPPAQMQPQGPRPAPQVQRPPQMQQPRPQASPPRPSAPAPAKPAQKPGEKKPPQ